MIIINVKDELNLIITKLYTTKKNEHKKRIRKKLVYKVIIVPLSLF